MLPEGYSARPARLEDAAAVAAVIGLCQLAAFGAVEIDESEVRDDWAGVDMASDTLVIEREGEPRAFADLVIRPGQVSVYGYVHPAETGRGLGSYLTAWGEQRALAEAAASSEPIVVRHYVVSTNRAATRLLEERGYGFVRAVLWMERDLTGTTAGRSGGDHRATPPALPPGTSLRRYRGDSDEPAAHQAFEAGSLDMNGRAPNSIEQWLAVAGTKDKDLFFIVEADGAPAAAGNGAIVGILIASLRGPTGSAVAGGAPEGGDRVPAETARGYVDSLRVVREWRRRGIGAALLSAAFAALKRRGAVTVGLSVDANSPTGAPSLYLRAGMHVTRRYLVMERTFGADGR